MSDLFLHLGGQFDGKVRPAPRNLGISQRYTVPVRQKLRMADYVIEPEALANPSFETEDYELIELLFFGRVLRMFVAVKERGSLPDLVFKHVLSSAAKSTVEES